MKADEKTEEELIGTLVKLTRRDHELYTAIEKLLEYNGDFKKALEHRYGDVNDLERLYKAEMSVNPDKIIELAEQLRKLQKEYEVAHKELREFEGKYPSIAQKYGHGQSTY